MSAVALILVVAWALYERYRSRPMYEGYEHPLWAKWQQAERDAANHRHDSRYWRERYVKLCTEQNYTKRRAILAESRARLSDGGQP